MVCAGASRSVTVIAVDLCSSLFRTDPTHAQFSVFQKVFGKTGLVAGNPPFVDMDPGEKIKYAIKNTKVKHKSWKRILGDPEKVFVWYDYFCVPQPGTAEILSVLRDSVLSLSARI